MRIGHMSGALVIAMSFGATASAQDGGKQPNTKYVPVLPEVKARFLSVDPEKGYLVKQVKPDVFAITGDDEGGFAPSGPLAAPGTYSVQLGSGWTA